MKNTITEIKEKPLISTDEEKQTKIDNLISQSWKKIAPSWPLKNLIAVNPLAGFEDLSFEDALRQGRAYFETPDLPEKMHEVNAQSIKWLQTFFDNGQATISMPLKSRGLYKSVVALLPYDKRSTLKNGKLNTFLQNLPKEPKAAIAECLLFLGIRADQQDEFLTLMLTTLPGWSAYIKYRTSWADAADLASPYTVTQADYIALRLVLTCLIYSNAKELLEWHNETLKNIDIKSDILKIEKEEKLYHSNLLEAIDLKSNIKNTTSDAQIIFCIDVRSEPFRRVLEAQGPYETFGFAGFFGIPVSIENLITGESHASCPVLLKPSHKIIEEPICHTEKYHDIHHQQQKLKSLYQSLKYTFTTPLTLVEALGPFAGLWMGLRSFLPYAHSNLNKRLRPSPRTQLDVSNIPFEQQVNYALGALRMMGLTENFSPLVVFCGHGSETQNNAYATSLDCGACGGHNGAPNAKILATILNNKNIRAAISKQNIIIPDLTYFIAAQHNTTTDEVELYETKELPQNHKNGLEKLKKDLQKACEQNSRWRTTQLGVETQEKAAHHTALRSQDWAQVRPEWGLAGNAAFIIGPRILTKDLNLEGRCFLHSYDYSKDSDGSHLTTILTAPMVVAQWINSQYFFSTYDNVAYGGGSKISKNVTGKIGIMQGNASDLMNGLPLQSVNKTDTESYHQTLRLITIIYAPRLMIERIVRSQEILQKLFSNGWVKLACIEPKSGEKFILERDLSWQKQL